MHTVGIIPSPGVAHEHAKKIIPRVKKLLTERIDGDNHWNFDIKVDLMIGSAEDVHESVDKAAKLKRATSMGLCHLFNRFTKYF